MSDSDGDQSAPPDVQHGDEVPADQAPAGAGAAGAAGAAGTHPVWAAAAGRGGGGGSNKGGGSTSLFAPISMMELELRGRGDLDGASSTASVHGKDKRREKGKRKNAKRPREYDDADDDDDDDDDGRASVMGSEPDLANAAFGGKRKACVPCGSEVSDDALSVTSTDKRAAHARAFPVSGVTCVGCALPAKVVPVVEFISKNMSSMSEVALFKMAAMVYLNKVAEPAEEEGVSVPVSTTQPHPHCAASASLTRPRANDSRGTGRTSGRTSRCTRSTPSSSASRTSARWLQCARRSRCNCCAATRRAASSRSTSRTPSRFSRSSPRPAAS
jgi:hypothetical protein